uniref:Uncharacterized protein n=1 Tax=Brassica oleracea var. oleracea TaxID=109376 RepID=A0A0D3B240_BRAOL
MNSRMKYGKLTYQKYLQSSRNLDSASTLPEMECWKKTGLLLLLSTVDAWLLSVSFYFGSRFGFDSCCNNRFKSNSKVKDLNGKSSKTIQAMDEEEGLEKEVEDEHGDTLCGACEDYSS